MSDRTEVGACLTILRIARGWKQNELAERAGVTNSAISDYERGKADPQTETFFRILKALGAPMRLVDQARDFLAMARAAMEGGPDLSLGEDGDLVGLPTAIAAEIGAIASDGASFTARATRMQLGLLARLCRARASRIEKS